MGKTGSTVIDLDKIIEIQEKIKSKQVLPETEEATKLWFIMPILVALGYDMYTSDIIPEYTCDVGTKKGEKVDYALQINNQPVAIVECKQLNVQLSDNNISQLYRYFTTADIHIAILTNGNDWWFFTDSQKENVMDLEPYYKLKLSEASKAELLKFEMYSKELIQDTKVSSIVQYEKFQAECRELAKGICSNNIPKWLIDVMLEKANIANTSNLDKPTLANYLYTEIDNRFKFKVEKVEKVEKVGSKQKVDENTLGERMKAAREENKKNISKIKLHHEYVYNDYSDGDWKFHTMEYAIILGEKFPDISGREMLIKVLTKLLDNGTIDRDSIVAEEKFKGTYKVLGEQANIRGLTLIEEHNVYMTTAYGIEGIIKFISRLLEYAGIQNEEVKVSFKE